MSIRVLTRFYGGFVMMWVTKRILRNPPPLFLELLIFQLGLVAVACALSAVCWGCAVVFIAIYAKGLAFLGHSCGSFGATHT